MRLLTATALLVVVFSWHTDAASPKLVALTFDDGPRPEFLKDALPYFQQGGIEVTFFAVGGKIRKYSHWAKRIVAERHSIENHTLNHKCLVRPSPQWTGCNNASLSEALYEVSEASRIITEVTGRTPIFLRPPHFAMTPARKSEIERALGIRVLAHDDRISIGSLDWVFKDPAKVAERVIQRFNQVGDGPHVIVFHENDVTLRALPRIIKFLRSRGYEFVTLEELAKRNPHIRL
ncbi:MAG: polysaccharide deacetylase family protein [Parcubacteria group bacterium]|nr:polysaccharide deacetylase family protein [Parcubacteria group bacterium]